MVILSLTPIERWEALHQYKPSFPALLVYIFLISLFVLCVLAIIIHAVKYRKTQKRRLTESAFDEKLHKAGLTPSESAMVLHIADMAGLERKENILRVSSIFDRMAIIMIAQCMMSKGIKAGKRLKAKLSLLRVKLGYKIQDKDLTDLTVTMDDLTSRHIPLNQELMISLARDQSSNTAAMVIGCDDSTMTLKLKEALKCRAGDMVGVKGFFEDIITIEFETSVIRCDGDFLVLSHQTDLRFSNRRRYPRVAANIPAFIAADFEPDKLTSATIVELAGPGVLLKTDLGAKEGEKVLLKFQITYQNPLDPNEKTEQATIESRGVIRRVNSEEDQFLLAVEMNELEKNDLIALISATYDTYLKLDTPIAEK